jgi:hypothetical protein
LSAPAMAQQQVPRPHGNYQRGYPGDTIMLTYSDSSLRRSYNRHGYLGSE